MDKLAVEAARLSTGLRALASPETIARPCKHSAGGATMQTGRGGEVGSAAPVPVCFLLDDIVCSQRGVSPPVREMIAECPHCFTRMIPKADGTCPACQKDTRDMRGTDPTRTSLRVSQGDVLPAICCDCGHETERRVAVCQSSCGEQDQPSGVVQAFIALFISWPMAIYFFLRGIKKTSVVSIKMPQCKECAQRSTPHPRYVDFPNARMTFVVHKNLKEAIGPEESD